jgi:hypothetical protein
MFLYQIYFDEIVETGEKCIQTPYGTPFKGFVVVVAGWQNVERIP